MSDQPIIFRSWEDKDEPLLIELLGLVSGDAELNSPEFFDWQYRQNPVGRAFIGCAQESGGKIVSQTAAVPVRLRVGGKSVLASFAINAATHPDYRRLKLFSGCQGQLFKDQNHAGVAYTFAFPTLHSYLGALKEGFTNLGLTGLMMRMHDPKASLADEGLYHDWFFLGSIASWCIKAVQKQPRLIEDVEEVDSFDNLPISDLMEPDKIVVELNDRWLTWRYKKNPTRKYRIAVARKRGKITGLAVYRVKESGKKKWGIIMELMAADTAGIETVESLMHHVFRSNMEAGCSLTLCLTTPGSRKERMLGQCGFWQVPKRIRSRGNSTGLLICRNNLCGNGQLSLNKIDLAFGMHDVL